MHNSDRIRICIYCEGGGCCGALFSGEPNPINVRRSKNRARVGSFCGKRQKEKIKPAKVGRRTPAPEPARRPAFLRPVPPRLPTSGFHHLQDSVLQSFITSSTIGSDTAENGLKFVENSKNNFLYFTNLCEFAKVRGVGPEQPRREQRGRGARLRVALRRRAGRAARARHRGGARRAAGAAGIPAVQGAARGTNSWLISRNDKMIN